MTVQKRSDDAVSPVIGIMLMLVVTVLIAAVVSAFSTGLVSDVEPAPHALISIEDTTVEFRNAAEGYDLTWLALKHKSGDDLILEDIQLLFTRNGITQYALTDLTELDTNGDGRWTAGETFLIHKPASSYGILSQSVQLPTEVHFRVVTANGDIIAEGDERITK